MNSELDRMFEHSMSNLSRAPQAPLTDEQIATAAKASKTGAVLWLRMHVKEILLCAIFLAIGIAGTLLVTHSADNQDIATKPEETVATVAGDTAIGAADTDMLSDGPATKTNTESTSIPVETMCTSSPQTDRPVTTSAEPHNKPAASAVETRQGTSLQPQIPSVQSHPTHPKTNEPVVIKKTIIQRDTVIINETITVKDTVYLMDN